MQNSDLILAYYQALNARDWVGLTALLHPQVLYEVPQTRERVRGAEAYVDFNATFPGPWSLEVQRVVADGLRGCAECVSHVQGQAQMMVAWFVFEGGLISRVTDYWPEQYEPPARASRFVERY